ncbi:MAG: DUF3488 and transglutaminase-like domain-containing protein [Pseudomonadota bacterium]
MKRWLDMALMLPRDKADTLLLLVAALLVLVPHANHLPLWISALCGATLFWRGAVTWRGLRMPATALLLPIALAAMAGVFNSYHTLLGRDAGVAMLVLLVAFKMLEMHAKRDLFVVIFLCIFLVLTNFFYSQSMGTALMMLISIIVLLTAQMSFQFTGAVPPLARRLRTGATILGCAAPLALLLFVGFPRIQGPLWGLPGDASAGRSGLSDRMSPGNLSNLAQSEETAFRVKFSDPVPPQDQLYWRGIVLGNFDGRTWSQLAPMNARQASNIQMQVRGKPVRHQITLEPSSNRWLFSLDMPTVLPSVAGNLANLSQEVEMSASYPLDQRVRYDVVSYIDYALEAERLPQRLPQWLEVPTTLNPRSLNFAIALSRQPRPEDRVNELLKMFATDRFVYTLEPPLLGKNSIDEFIFETRAGFCEHYAGAFVFIMRAAGVPARVVTGYQGGEFNPVDGFLTVRQSDAHAWAEVWLKHKGWVRVDPTAAVSPDRVQRNLARAIPRRPPLGIDALGNLINFGSDRNSLLGQLRLQWSAMNNGWNQWVLNYSPERQKGFLDALYEALATPAAAIGALAIAGLIMLARALGRRRQIDPVDALYSALCEQLARRGLARALHEGPMAYAARVQGMPETSEKIQALLRFLQLYSDAKYGAAPRDPRLAATLKRLLNETR